MTDRRQRPRTSTILLSLAFVMMLAIYLLVRPARPTAPAVIAVVPTPAASTTPRASVPPTMSPQSLQSTPAPTASVRVQSSGSAATTAPAGTVVSPSPSDAPGATPGVAPSVVGR